MEARQTIVEVKGLTKVFGGTVALRDASIVFRRGEVHALCGENGAGKSTLCKMLSGALVPTGGVIAIDGREHARLTPREAKACGIGMIYQEFNLVPELPVYENIFIGKELRRGVVVDRAEMIRQTRELFDRMQVKVDPCALIRGLSVAYCQLVEIAKALKEDVRVLIMDEPTAPLTNQEVGVLFGLVRTLREQGITILYISHRMEEVMELSDRLTVMRDGAVVCTMDTAGATQKQIIEMMVGRELGADFPAKGGYEGPCEELLAVSGLTNDKISDVSFTLHRGEILGLAGLVGAGRTETLRAVFGADPIRAGEVRLRGKPVRIASPADAIRQGIGMIPEDRKRQGVHLQLSIRENMSLIVIQKLSRFLTVSRRRESALIGRYMDTLRIKMGSPALPVSSLSGGNQQKVVLTKWLATEPEILFFDEPTRGIDVGAKQEIYHLLDALRRQGKAIVIVSSELPEIIGMCDRILVLYEGRLMGELDGASATQEAVMAYASGITDGEGPT